MKSHNNALDMRDSYRGPDLQLFFRDLRDDRRRKVTVKSWSTIKDVKDVISSILHIPSSSQRLFYGPLAALPNYRSLLDAGIDRSGETLLLDIQTETSNFSRLPDINIASSMIEQTPKRLQQLIQQTRRGLALGLKPQLVLDGSGGTYYMHDARKSPVAVFKPADEEPYAQNNPRGYVGGGSLREGIQPGQLCLREVAAYLLDHKGFSSVPMTTLAQARHPAFHSNGTRLNISQGGASLGNHSLTPKSKAEKALKKVGSFQAFVRAECTMDDLSSSKISKDEIHKIAILDLRLMNADRNSANLLCRRKSDNSLELVPIDHGYCLRSVCDVSWMDWCWLDWPQLKEPVSRKTKSYIMKLDIEKDVRLLRETLNIQGPELDYFRASNKLLQQGIKSGLTLYEIAILCCRNDNMGEIPSKLELLTEMATELSNLVVDNGKWHHTTASRAIADQLSPADDLLLKLKLKPSPRSNSLTSFGLYNQQEGVPTMTQSSGSDSSSDLGDDVATDQEECEEWAAAAVADVSMDKYIQPHHEFDHTLDHDGDESNSSLLSSSPKGFWHVRPGDQDSDSESVTWSPHISPQNCNKKIANIGLRNKLGGQGKPTVTFADSLSGSFLLPPPATVVTVDREQCFQESDSSFLSKPSGGSGGGMIRSKSTGAFLNNSITASSSFNNTGGDDIWASNFHKFVDLVIKQETSAAVAASKD
mmetsp:Transcript_5514/g.7997  ORF Transcript_5514/g.7997 Transcript_5514/m.7997 type:complete len:703 (-) Transcript_5514:87-2195(-)|eukprot:CAMPEP_0202475022 /NCGR_PEP_ID=MMETSP1360-20130828/92684_1 /ASSEMBLY_ACC=CAM_ASM_000848 /TAXON_ID=515479 /ORGANISM="Licmophora paradoxa, Strain CCMP2313" /LENGTH=702 /DNA_ID=CAMNT_0049102167 /DNA_START=430 /DNA_END=2538 /DNA_ORIENTATION=-